MIKNAFEKEKKCKHFNAYILGTMRISYAWCPDCQKEVLLLEVFNNMLTKLREVIKKNE